MAGKAPYLEFTPRRDHADASIAALQNWVEAHLDTPRPVEEMSARSGLTRRTLERRFRSAIGYPPIAYLQQLRIHRARRLLERTPMPVEQVGFAVGYLNIAHFRRVFQRTTHLTPGAYRRRFGGPPRP